MYFEKCFYAVLNRSFTGNYNMDEYDTQCDLADQDLEDTKLS